MSFSGEGFHFGLGCEAEGGSEYCQGFSVRGGQYHVNQSSFFLYCSVISIVPCLILLLLPANCSYLNLCSFPFVPASVLSGLPHGEGGLGSWGASKWQHGLEGLSGSTKLGSITPKP